MEQGDKLQSSYSQLSSQSGQELPIVGEQLEALADVLRKYEIFVICDEVYPELTYTGEAHVSLGTVLRETRLLLLMVCLNRML